MRKIKVYSALLLLLITTLGNVVYSQSLSKESVDFHLKRYEYGRLSKSDLYGKVALIIITASWDLEFNNDLNKVKELQRLFASKDVEFIYIVGDLPERWKTFAENKGLKGEFYYLPSMSKGCKRCFLSSHFDETEITSYYILSKDGSLLGKHLPSPAKSEGIEKLLAGASVLKIN
ncbi:TlpA family protein disulfide reductase [Flammeovirga aprica]|uniref:Redoxin domain-containing protein n=1 Tax=Flammeovirga aprica JL-4 TaxID=694437 RepID=A0A7X9RZB7_9BACT|nr:redoxin domain-containing protein [Flammeovirga aprica]NME71468.1 redoxin domain-containing protein [Flammeovirga aprica JL-4]